MNGDRLKIAVFIDFDNIEIGVKSTLNRHFDIGAVLEAIKEKGEVVTKIAYGDWKRAGEHSRGMTQHAIQMVQRNLTPGGDKNGADINLALDALEMAFTRNHINTFVIVGGDSDFIALVEKLKQYDKQVFIVGGRAFTSVILQKNCHEFIAYENLIAAPTPVHRRPTAAARPGAVPVVDTNLSKAVPVVRRALKVLLDREVSPQLGLLKSTLLQLDSTFSERDYGANTFRDFIEKMASAGYVNLKQVDRSLLVEMKDGDLPSHEEPQSQPVDAQPLVQPLADPRDAQPRETTGNRQPREHRAPREHRDSRDHRSPRGHSDEPREPRDGNVATTPPPPLGPPGQMDEGVRIIQEAFQNAKVQPHWPMYLRNVKQFIKNAAPAFDERRYGFPGFLDVVRAAQKAGVLRLERNRQGILRVYPGPEIPQPPRPSMPQMNEDIQMGDEPHMMSETITVEAEPILEAISAEDIIDVAAEALASDDVAEGEESSGAKPSRKKKAGTATRKKAAAPKEPKEKKPAAKRARKKASDEDAD